MHISHILEVMSPGGEHSFEMNGRQQLVRRSLAEKAAEIGDLYECALRALSDNANPCNFFLAAHAIRIMMDRLPRVLNLPTLAEQGRLDDKVSALESKWNSAQKSNCYSDGKWMGDIDDALRRSLQGLGELFRWRKEHRPKRRSVVSGLLRNEDPSGLAVPPILEEKRINAEEREVDAWLGLHDYFVRVAKMSQTTMIEFQQCLDELEQLLLDTLYRQPSVDLSKIDAILGEEQPDA